MTVQARSRARQLNIWRFRSARHCMTHMQCFLSSARTILASLTMTSISAGTWAPESRPDATFLRRMERAGISPCLETSARAVSQSESHCHQALTNGTGMTTPAQYGPDRPIPPPWPKASSTSSSATLRCAFAKASDRRHRPPDHHGPRGRLCYQSSPSIALIISKMHERRFPCRGESPLAYHAAGQPVAGCTV